MSTMRRWPGCATVSYLRTAVQLVPRPEPEPVLGQNRSASITKSTDDAVSLGGSNLVTGIGKFDAALAVSSDALIAEWMPDHANADCGHLDHR